MTQKLSSISREVVKQALPQDDDFLRPLIQRAIQEILQAEMEQRLLAGKSQRTTARLGCRSGDYSRGLITRIGQLQRRVPQDRQGHFRTAVFERDQRSDR